MHLLSNPSEWLAAIVESSDDAIVGKTLDSVIRSWNAGAKQMFGYTAEEAIGQSVLMLIPPELQDEERRIVAQLTRGERVHHFETVRLRKDRSRVEVSLSISPIVSFITALIGEKAQLCAVASLPPPAISFLSRMPTSNTTRRNIRACSSQF